MAIGLFIFWIISIPLIVWNGFYEGPKVFVFLIGGFLLTLFWIIKILKNSVSLSLEKKDFWFLGWLAVLTISSLLGVHPLDSIIGGSYRHQGIIFFLTLWLAGKTIGLFDTKKRALLYKGIGFVVIAESLIVLFQVIFGKLYFGKPLGTLGEANAVAGFLAAGSSFLTFLNPVFTAVVLFAVISTASKIGLFSFIVVNILYLRRAVNKKLLFILVPVILLVSVAVGYRTLGAKVKFLFAPKTELWQLEQEDRVLIWRMALTKIRQRPILGWGAESSEVVFNAAYKENDMSLLGIIVDRAHNLLFDVAMWSGGIGLILFTGWLYFSFLKLKDLGRKLAFAGFFVFSMFQPLSVVHWILLIIVVNI